MSRSAMKPIYGDIEANSGFIFTLACILAGEHISIENDTISIKKTIRPEVLLIEKVVDKGNSKEVITRLIGDNNPEKRYSFPIITKRKRMSATEIVTIWNTMMLKNASKLSETGINFLGVPLEEINSLSSRNFYFMIDKRRFRKINKISNKLKECFNQNKIITVSGDEIELTRNISNIKEITIEKNYPYFDIIRGVFYMLRFIGADDLDSYMDVITNLQVLLDKDIIMDVESSALLIFVSVQKIMAFIPIWYMMVKNSATTIESQIDAPSVKSFIENCIHSYVFYMNIITETVRPESKIIKLGNSFGYLD